VVTFTPTTPNAIQSAIMLVIADASVKTASYFAMHLMFRFTCERYCAYTDITGARGPPGGPPMASQRPPQPSAANAPKFGHLVVKCVKGVYMLLLCSTSIPLLLLMIVLLLVVVTQLQVLHGVVVKHPATSLSLQYCQRCHCLYHIYSDT
jgi:hypothetical protein